MLIALLLPAVQAAREAARRSQCTNHLKQFGLAVHNFQQQRNGLPPCVTGNASATLWMVLFPYVEQQTLYDFYVQSSLSNTDHPTYRPEPHTGFNVFPSKAWWEGMQESQRAGFASVPIAKCPTRRSGGQRTRDPSYHPGPCNDYAMPVYNPSLAGNPNPTNWWNWRDTSITTADSFMQPFRVPVFGTHLDANSWIPRDKMGWWRDGSSHQIIFGEKHIPSRFLNACLLDPSEVEKGPESRWTKAGDCSYLGAFGNCREFSAARVMHESHRLANGPRDYDTTDEGVVLLYGFGSYHPGVCQFAIGDGSIRGVSNTTNMQLLCWLTDVQDGNSATLP